MKTYLAPSILCSDFGNLSKSIDLIESSSADWYHLDVMDGVFVPNISFGAPILEAIGKRAKKPMDVHLMISQPERYVDMFHKLGAYIITVHCEACTHLDRTLHEIKRLGLKAGVALNPATPVSLLECVADMVDLVLIMSVNPGFGGQKFIEKTYGKVSEVKKLLTKKNNTKAWIQVDGGVDLDNFEKLATCGANAFVAGSAIFNAPEPREVIEKFCG